MIERATIDGEEVDFSEIVLETPYAVITIEGAVIEAIELDERISLNRKFKLCMQAGEVKINDREGDSE